ncbi:hypothetical protein CFO_g2760 [Ceratocystis platani]|uniref:Glycoside hydrolase 131 catalytic N-terminal domain-containing protein n=1 Tax=Ceratocystis fimbriata f. sp. platani TaxID=88771 RepID=A0A0F8DFY2_CERFI|nr:hypothetical protein CFO_g2760 [Ceratocystis platani]
MKSFASLLLLGAPALASILWDGRFNDMTSSADLGKWSWSTPVGSYQYYIHGSGEVTEYVNLSADYKNPADTGSNQGAKITLTNTAYWNGQNMRRTELIPQTTAAINKGKVTYHFSMMRSETNAPSIFREHQIAFFESHFCEMKYGWLSGESGESNPNLQFFAASKSQWKAEWAAGVWHNIAYEIDFDGNTVAFWHSTGSDPLTKVVDAVSVTATSDGKDWHLGVLELQRTGYEDADEDFYFSSVYIEDGEVTTGFPAGGSTGGSPGGSAPSSAASSASATSAPTAATPAVATPAVATPAVANTPAGTTPAVNTPAANPEYPAPTTLSTVTSSAAPANTPAVPEKVNTPATGPSSTGGSYPSSSKTPSTCARRRSLRNKRASKWA